MANLIPMISDLLLFAAALGAGIYCLILSRRLTRLSSFDKGLGGAIAVLSAQVDDMTKALAEARAGSDATAERLAGLMKEAETLANDLEVMLSSCHDLPFETGTAPDTAPEPAAPGDAPDAHPEAEAAAAAPDQPDPPDQPEEPADAAMPAFGSRRAQASAEAAGAAVFRHRGTVREAAE